MTGGLRPLVPDAHPVFRAWRRHREHAGPMARYLCEVAAATATRSMSFGEPAELDERARLTGAHGEAVGESLSRPTTAGDASPSAVHEEPSGPKATSRRASSPAAAGSGIRSCTLTTSAGAFASESLSVARRGRRAAARRILDAMAQVSSNGTTACFSDGEANVFDGVLVETVHTRQGDSDQPHHAYMRSVRNDRELDVGHGRVEEIRRWWRRRRSRGSRRPSSVR
jgi:hypothetical protein